MSKDPAFLFYPNDYIGGTMGMTLEEKGAYMELLMMQFNRGHMTSHMIGQTIGQLWDKIQNKFIKDENGLWYNQRLEEEQGKRKAFTESRRNNKLGINQHTKKRGRTTLHTNARMEDEDVNVNKKEDIVLNYKFKELEFINDWDIWKVYKRTQFNFKYKSVSTEQTAINSLYKLSNGNFSTAIEIMNRSIANGWKGFFKLDKEQQSDNPLISAVR